MVQYSEQEHSVDAPLAFVALAHNQRFPSPYATHVISSDVISRSFHPQTNTLRTTRLVLKRGKMPAWAPARVAEVGTSWVLEESELDMEGEQRWLRVRSRNIDHKTVMEVFEWQSFKQMEGDDQQ
ncbi:hypothetical protein MNV49_007431 [Pseudohyphozyma bogoriensis]|nr:hypothetical protein MNV49_007431 [Pseudohyphozyma bogoriensis]